MPCRRRQKSASCGRRPQANATSGLGLNPDDAEISVYECLVDSAPAEKAVMPTCIEGLSIICSRIDLVGAEVELMNRRDREKALSKVLEPLKDDYDYILIDCSPSLGIITVNALTAADSVIIPVQAEYFALEGISQLLNTIRIIKSRLKPTLEIEGFLLTMYDARLQTCQPDFRGIERSFRRYGVHDRHSSQYQTVGISEPRTARDSI